MQPCENQKHDWPFEHASVPFVQLHVYGSIQPVGGWRPSRHAGRVASIELRDGGMIMLPWPSTVAAEPSRISAPISALIVVTRRAPLREKRIFLLTLRI